MPQAVEVLRLGVRGDAFRKIAAALGCSTMPVYRLWMRIATAEQKRQRQFNQAGYGRWRRRQDLECLLLMARRGETWKAIGARFYPDMPVESASGNAHTTFIRHATEDDKQTRSLAVRSRNGNRKVGMSKTAERRRRKLGIEDFKVQPERYSPFVGMGECFA